VEVRYTKQPLVVALLTWICE